MIHSDLAGKNGVPEDVFTSNCLGLLRLLDGTDMLDFFQAAKGLRDETLDIGDCRDAEITLTFWPYLPGGGIPDAIVEINTKTEKPFGVIVEVKHGAGKTGSGEDDQLSRYWGAAQSRYPG